MDPFFKAIPILGRLISAEPVLHIKRCEVLQLRLTEMLSVLKGKLNLLSFVEWKDTLKVSCNTSCTAQHFASSARLQPMMETSEVVERGESVAIFGCRTEIRFELSEGTVARPGERLGKEHYPIRK